MGLGRAVLQRARERNSPEEAAAARYMEEVLHVPDDVVIGPAGQLRAFGQIATSLLLDRDKAKAMSRAKGLDVDQVRQHLEWKNPPEIRCTRSRAAGPRRTRW